MDWITPAGRYQFPSMTCYGHHCRASSQDPIDRWWPPLMFELPPKIFVKLKKICCPSHCTMSQKEMGYMSECRDNFCGADVVPPVPLAENKFYRSVVSNNTFLSVWIQHLRDERGELRGQWRWSPKISTTMTDIVKGGPPISPPPPQGDRYLLIGGIGSKLPMEVLKFPTCF